MKDSHWQADILAQEVIESHLEIYQLCLSNSSAKNDYMDSLFQVFQIDFRKFSLRMTRCYLIFCCYEDYLNKSTIFNMGPDHDLVYQLVSEWEFEVRNLPVAYLGGRIIDCRGWDHIIELFRSNYLYARLVTYTWMTDWLCLTLF